MNPSDSSIILSMPIYEFTCEKCGATFDELLSPARRKGAVPCPSCGAGKTRQNLSSFAARSSGSKPGPSGGGGCAPRGRMG